MQASVAGGSAAASATVARRAFRRSGRQLDVAEWCKQHIADLRQLRTKNCKEEPGVFTYLKWGGQFVSETMAARKQRKAEQKEMERANAAGGSNDTAVAKAAEDADSGYDSPMNQLLRSMELLKRFKWKRVTWDKGADFDGFSNRLLNSNIVNGLPAFSFLCMHLIRDTGNQAALDTQKQQQQQQEEPEGKLRRPAPLGTSTISLKQGDITNWFFTELDESAATVAENSNNGSKGKSPLAVVRELREQSATPLRSPFRVDWDAGEVYILDTASPDEVLSFLRGPAQSLQSLQSRRADEEATLATRLENTRLQLGAFCIKVNEFDRYSYSDFERKANPRGYVDPADVKLFCDAVARNSIVMRYYLRDQNVRIVARGQPYRVDPATLEISIPADFEEYHTASIHGLMRPLQRLVIVYRASWALWLLALLVLIGDTEFI